MSDTTADADVTIDARGATCPGPLMDLIGRVKTAESGTVIALLTSDSSSRNDVPDWVEQTPHEYLGVDELDDHWRITIKVA